MYNTIHVLLSPASSLMMIGFIVSQVADPMLVCQHLQGNNIIVATTSVRNKPMLVGEE